MILKGLKYSALVLLIAGIAVRQNMAGDIVGISFSTGRIGPLALLLAVIAFFMGPWIEGIIFPGRSKAKNTWKID